MTQRIAGRYAPEFANPYRIGPEGPDSALTCVGTRDKRPMDKQRHDLRVAIAQEGHSVLCINPTTMGDHTGVLPWLVAAGRCHRMGPQSMRLVNAGQSLRDGVRPTIGRLPRAREYSLRRRLAAASCSGRDPIWLQGAARPRISTIAAFDHRGASGPRQPPQQNKMRFACPGH